MERSKITDVAKMAGVGVATVSRALNNSGYVGEKTRKKIMEAVEYYDYQPNLIARSLVQKSTALIGVVVSDILNPFYSKLIHAIQTACNEYKYSIILCNTDESTEKEKEYLSLLLNNRVNVIILAGGRGIGESYSGHLPEVAKKIPIILINEFIDADGIYCVYCDKEEGSYRMTQHLIDLGHRDIVHIAGYPDYQPTQDRLSGYLRAMKEHGLPVTDDSVIYSDYHALGGYAVGLELLKRSTLPTAVFASNDLMAIGCLNVFQENGISVPAEVSVVGSDNILFSEFVSPGLTTINHDVEALGKRSVRMMMSLINNTETEKSEIIKTDLVIRKSSGKPR